MFLACEQIPNAVKEGEAYLLVVSEHCHWCQEALKAIQEDRLTFKRRLVVANFDTCDSINNLVGVTNLPMIAHFRDGKVVRKAEGLDDIETFDNEDPANEPQTPRRDDQEGVNQ